MRDRPGKDFSGQAKKNGIKFYTLEPRCEHGLHSCGHAIQLLQFSASVASEPSELRPGLRLDRQEGEEEEKREGEERERKREKQSRENQVGSFSDSRFPLRTDRHVTRCGK